MRLRFPLARVSSVLLVAACATALLLAASPALALDTSQRSASEIQARWRQLKPVYSGSPYEITPSWSSPFSAGALNAGFLQDGVNSINYARFLAGLPDDVTLDAANNDKAQHGAVLLAAGSFAHSQPKPADMGQAFYDVANGATSSSNIGWGYGNLASFNFSCMDDDDTGNIDRVGHRRWILDPPLFKTGLGFANARSDTYVFDWSRTSAVAYDSVKWPAAGPFPVEMFGATVPWSVTLNPSLYSWTSGTAGHTVTLRRERDGKVWTFTSADTNQSGQYFNFETNGYGVANCFIFRPDPASVGSYAVGDIFDVTISGGITSRVKGQPATVSYSTQFMSQAAQTPPPPLRTPGTVVGTVSAGGAPLAGASVKLGSMGVVVTGFDGTYQISNVQPGTCAAVFSKPGYLPQTIFNVAVAEEGTSTQNATLTFRPSIACSPSASSLTIWRRNGVARWTSSATFGGVAGAQMSGLRVYVQTSKNGKTGWTNVCGLTTNPGGRASRVLTARKRETAYYRWYVGATSASCIAATSRQKVVVR